MKKIIDNYQKAVNLFSSSKLDEAEVILKRLVAADKNDYDALNFLGIIKLNRKDYESAIIFFEKVRRIRPSHYTALYNLGLAYQYLKSDDKSISCYEKVIVLKPEYTDALNNLALIYKKNREYEKAEKYFFKIIELEPKNASALNNLGNLFLEAVKYDEAVHFYQKALEIEPLNPDYNYNLATCFLKKDCYKESIKYLMKTVEIKPDHLEALNNLGVVFCKVNDFESAEAVYSKISDFETKNFHILLNKANTLKQNKKYSEAKLIYEEILAEDPENTTALFNLSEIYHQQGLVEQADNLISRFTNLKSGKAALFTNIALSKMKHKDFEEAKSLCARALFFDSNPVIQYNLAHLQLLTGIFDEGWRNYEIRTEREDFKKRKVSKPVLKDQPLEGKTIFVYDEQGLGDSIHFVRYLKLLKEKNCRIIFECDPRLISLYAGLKFCDEIIPRKNLEEEPVFEYDYHISLLSLPLFFNTNLETIPAGIPYIEAPQKLASELSSVIRKENIFNVGIVWAGNPNHTNDKNRSCQIEYFEPLFKLDSTRFFSLQKGDGVRQFQEKNYPVIDLDSKGLKSFTQTAAVIDNLDLVISVDTSVAHLAGAMGKKVWVLLPYIPDWRWMLERSDSPWYPTMKLFRQTRPGNWEDVFNDLLPELQDEILKLNFQSGVILTESDFK